MNLWNQEIFFFFFNHLGSKNTNFSVGLCYILELVSNFRVGFSKIQNLKEAW